MIAQLFNASISGAIGVAVVWTLCRVMPRLSASVKALLWSCAAAKFLVALLWVSPLQISVLPATVSVPLLTQAAPSSPPLASSVEPLVSSAVSTNANAAVAADVVGWASRAALVIWSLGVIAAAGVGVRRWRRARQMIRQSSPAPAHVTDAMSVVAAEMGLLRAPRVIVSDDVETPLVIGVLRPVVMVPTARFLRLSLDERRMALAHECAHIRRADLRIGCVPALSEAIFFFHPLARLAAREYALWREAACDAAVIDALDTTPADYGRLLVGLGVSRPRVGLAAAGASWSSANLKRRLLMLTDRPVPSTRSRIAATLLVAAAVAAIVPVQLTARATTTGETRINITTDQFPPPPPPTPTTPPTAPLPPSPPSSMMPPVPPAPPAPRDWAMAELPPMAPMPPTSRMAPIPPLPPMPPMQRWRNGDQNFVLIVDDGKHIMSGDSSDVRRAESQRRPGEPLLWFKKGGQEYVIRDRAAINQAMDLWKPVNEPGDMQGKLGAEQGKLGQKQGEIGARQGAIGAEQGRVGEKQAEIELKQAELNLRAIRARDDSGRREVELERLNVQKEARRLRDEMQLLSAKLNYAGLPMNELGKQMEGLSAQMEKLSQRMQEASAKAEADMAKLIDRAIASGAAQAIR